MTACDKGSARSVILRASICVRWPCAESAKVGLSCEARKSLREFVNLARCIRRDMSKKYRIELDGFDLGQVLDGLEVRADAWMKTARYHRTGESPRDILVEE